MKVGFVAGFGPIVRDADSSRSFWGAGLGDRAGGGRAELLDE